jgi:hypothetical protein
MKQPVQHTNVAFCCTEMDFVAEYMWMMIVVTDLHVLDFRKINFGDTVLCKRDCCGAECQRNSVPLKRLFVIRLHIR